VTLLLMNPTHEAVTFTLPEAGFAWSLELDSDKPAEPAPWDEPTVTVAPHSLVLMGQRAESGDAT
jgi:glycogen operon protein